MIFRRPLGGRALEVRRVHLIQPRCRRSSRLKPPNGSAEPLVGLNDRVAAVAADSDGERVVAFQAGEGVELSAVTIGSFAGPGVVFSVATGAVLSELASREVWGVEPSQGGEFWVRVTRSRNWERLLDDNPAAGCKLGLEVAEEFVMAALGGQPSVCTTLPELQP
jgi:hypothetical protein